jgi:serine/threonine-protein kinase
VTLTLSAGSKMVAVPDLKGLTLDKARTILDSLSLQMDPEIVQQADPNAPPGTVIQTKPAGKEKVDRQSKIQLIVSTGNNGASRGVASQGGFLYTVRVGLDDLTDATAVKIDMTDSDGTREIFNEMRNPGDHVEVSAIGKDKQATFTIYYNDEKVAEKTQAATTPGGE